MRGVLDGEAGPCRDAVLLNAALALEVSATVRDWREAYEKARAALDCGAARDLLERLRTFAGSGDSS